MSSLLGILLICSFSAALGGVVGGLTGLVPGLHPNTLAILIAGLPGFLFASAYTDGGALLICSFMIGVLMSHSFMEVIPTTKMGIVGDDTAVILMPAQRLFLLGRGDLVIEAVLIGGLSSIAVSALLLIPIRAMMGQPMEIYSHMRPVMAFVLIAIVAVVLHSMRRSEKLRLSALIFGISGLFGLFILSFQVPTLITKSLLGGIWEGDPSSFLLPAFAGFFAIPSILFTSQYGISNAGPNAQDRTGKEIRMGNALLRGILPSIMVGWIPGITNAYATSFALSLGRDRGAHIEGSFRYLITYAAANIGGAFQAILALATINRPRNGTLEAVASIISWDEFTWNNILSPPDVIIGFFWSACIASVIGAILCAVLGKRVLDSRTGAPSGYFRKALLVFILVLIFFSSGPVGFLVLLPAFLMGTWAISLGAPRIHLMGLLIFPVIFYFILN